MTKILLVEDDEMNREIFVRRLVGRGYEVIPATTGQEALDLAADHAPTLILMDMGLPVVSGWEVARRLKASSDLRRIPIIALTAYALSEDRDRALESGCDDYESKPVDFDRLIEKIERLIAAASGNDGPVA